MWSANELRRCMVIICMIGVFIICYMFWSQPSTGSVAPNFESMSRAYEEFKPADLRWTWTCRQQRCERKSAIGVAVPHRMSLATCSMLCGSMQLWPQPTGPVTLGSRALSFHHKLIIYTSNAHEPAGEYLQSAFDLFTQNVAQIAQHPNYTNQPTDLSSLAIKIALFDSNVVKLKLATDESYHLTVRVDATSNHMQVDIAATNFFGARHALETMSQLIWWDDFDHVLKIIAAASVQDRPKFAYRGLMLDTSRNFIQLDVIKRAIIGMSANKLNVFHWHVSDSQSFPLLLPQVPELAKYGAYSPSMIYTMQEVKDLVKFAIVRGVRILIEIDMPAHVGSGWTWGAEKGMGELAVCVNWQPWLRYCGEPPCGQLNPDNPHVYELIRKIFEDILEATDERELYHLGGDEVNLNCWEHARANKNLTEYYDLHDLWGNFTLESIKKLKEANNNEQVKRIIVWSSALTKIPYISKYFDVKRTVIQSWGGSDWTETHELVANNYDVIISHVDAWYLDCGYGKWREQGGPACDPYRTWQTMYKHQPWEGNEQYRQHVLGGEACLWTEQVDTSSVELRLWPRVAAVAERLWSDPDMPDNVLYAVNEDVYARIARQRERLKGRGLLAEAPWPEWCTQNPGMCL